MNLFKDTINILFAFLLILIIGSLIAFIIFITKHDWTNKIIWGIILVASGVVFGWLYKAEKVTLFRR